MGTVCRDLSVVPSRGYELTIGQSNEGKMRNRKIHDRVLSSLPLPAQVAHLLVPLVDRRDERCSYRDL